MTSTTVCERVSARVSESVQDSTVGKKTVRKGKEHWDIYITGSSFPFLECVSNYISTNKTVQHFGRHNAFRYQ